MKVDELRYLDKAVEEEMEKDKPSSDPAYWAKKSCRHCCGRGVVGTQTTIVKGNNTVSQSLLCVCARKNFRKWKEEWLAARKQGEKKEEEIPSNGNGKPKDPSPVVAERLDRLGDHIAILNAEIIRCDTQMEELPQRSQIAAFDETIQMLRDSIMALDADFETTMAKVVAMRARAQELLEETKRLTRETDRIELDAKANQSKEVPETQGKIQEIQRAKEAVEKSLSRAKHQIRRRKRVIQDKLDRLGDRKYRLLKENQVEPGSDTKGLTDTAV